jgi:hypothetical protein
MVLVKIALNYLEHAVNHELVLCSRSGVQLGEFRLAPLYLPLWSSFCRAVCFLGKLLEPS